jgi:uncharacterized protein with HEPN domain
MLDAARRAQEFTADRDRADLETDDVIGLAVVRLLEIIAEAAHGISAQLRESHPEVPWPQIVGTRNRIIHGYFTVDLDIVWRIVRRDLPGLTKQFEEILAVEDG